ncbi:MULTISPECIES: ribonuclease HI family protein [Staphylococcus]|uniref:Ribonuclease HI family protein n=1 Tax=Staphylococcus hsinchuensis TaxID=3051183 RepID=A0ABZ3EC14_9STAP|nr:MULTISPECIES: ribonuclease HI family protein [unclassified Staphylococcus]
MAKIYFDAATAGNPGESFGAVVIITEDNRFHYEQSLGTLDNHSAEWATLIYAMECAIKHQIDTAIIYTDSQLVEDSIERGRVKSEKFRPYFNQAIKLSQQFDLFFVNWIPRNKNKEANHHAKNALYKFTKSNSKKH